MPHSTTSAPEIARRLREALDSHGWSVTEFVDRLKEAEASVKGATAVFDYTNGKKIPPINFVEDAADLLGVRRSWLAFGEEPRHVDPDVNAPLTRKVEARFERVAGDSATVQAQFHALLNRRSVARSASGAPPNDDEILTWTDEICGLVEGPWNQLTRGIGSTGADWYNYRVAMLHALMLAFSDGYVRRAIPLEEK